jgi:hypothetical protein
LPAKAPRFLADHLLMTPFHDVQLGITQKNTPAPLWLSSAGVKLDLCCDVEAVSVHDFDPGCHEILHEFFGIAVLGVDFGI